jgi:hypothetical protein
MGMWKKLRTGCYPAASPADQAERTLGSLGRRPVHGRVPSSRRPEPVQMTMPPRGEADTAPWPGVTPSHPSHILPGRNLVGFGTALRWVLSRSSENVQ